ncbi:MAG: RHS domain-containing protein [Ectothiorhodospiraceae bacterium]|nr:RHS domain-containing protein [Ectothiorhodospiraceae bacterium]
MDSETWVYTYDANGNVDTVTDITGLKDYGYDALDRLTRDDQPTQAADTLDYDRNGNRTRITDGVTTLNSGYLLNSNLLDTLGADTIGHDLAGNRVSDNAALSGGARTFEYNNAGRLFKVYEGATLIATYTYNYQGQRTRKVTATNTTVYHYDQAGSLISETDELGAPIKDVVYRGPVPIAQIDTNLTTESITYLHSDHLGTPRRGTDQNGVVVWSWDSDAFGATAANDDPDGDGVDTVVNLRFAGQYYDAETQLHYNYFRYYDPSTGRYITSDPIGLDGGLNTYGYVGGNPLRFIDALGLAPCSVGRNDNCGFLTRVARYFGGYGRVVLLVCRLMSRETDHGQDSHGSPRPPRRPAPERNEPRPRDPNRSE